MATSAKSPPKTLDWDRSREHALWDQGTRVVAGVDEAGIGPLAGPVVAAAVVLPKNFNLPGVNDSKKLTAKRREKLYPVIVEQALTYCIAVVDVGEIDQLNIYHAGLTAMARAVDGLSPAAEHLLIDGRQLPDPPAPQTRIVGGDAEEVSIAAASILAKVARDRIMEALHGEYPVYGFDRHKGYPTKQHQEALRAHGPSPVHRMSFEAVRDFSGEHSPLFVQRSEELAQVHTQKELAAWRLQLKDDSLSPGELKRLRGLAQRRLAQGKIPPKKPKTDQKGKSKNQIPLL